MLVTFIRFVFMISAAIGGFQLGEYLKIAFKDRTQAYLIAAQVLTILIIIGIGYVAGGIIGRKIDEALNKFITSLHKYTGYDLMIGSAGLIIGLVVAALISLPIARIEFAGTYLSIIIFIVCGYIGLAIAMKKAPDISHLKLTSTGLASKPASGIMPKILDTSIIIDGRMVDIAKTGFLEGRILVPRFVLHELQELADSEDSLKRNRARRGMDILQELQRDLAIEVEIVDRDFPSINGVDAKLILLAKEIDGAILTNDYNLNKIAQLEGLIVLNINELSNALKPVLLPGERMSVKIVKEGKELTQGVAYLDDGTMIVVEGGREKINESVDITVTSVLQTAAGRMIFAKVGPNGADNH